MNYEKPKQYINNTYLCVLPDTTFDHNTRHLGAQEYQNSHKMCSSNINHTFQLITNADLINPFIAWLNGSKVNMYTVHTPLLALSEDLCTPQCKQKESGLKDRIQCQ